MSKFLLVITLVFITTFVYAADEPEISPAIIQLEIRAAESDAERIRQEIRANQLELQNMQLRFPALQESVMQLSDELKTVQAQIKDLKKQLLPAAKGVVEWNALYVDPIALGHTKPESMRGMRM